MLFLLSSVDQRKGVGPGPLATAFSGREGGSSPFDFVPHWLQGEPGQDGQPGLSL